MSDQPNTTTPPVADKQQGVPANMVSMSDLWNKMVAEPTVAKESAAPAEQAAHPAQQQQQAPAVSDAPKVDRRFKITPQKAEPEPAKAQEKSAEAAPAQPDPLESLEPDKGVSEGAKQNFGKMREGYKTAKAERDALKKEVEAYKQQIEAAKKTSATAPTADYEAVKKERDTLADRIAKIAYKESPDYIAKYDVPKNNALGEAKELLDMAGKKADLDSLLGKPLPELGKALADITKGMDDLTRGGVYDAVRRANKIHGEAQQALANAKANAENVQQRNAYQSKAEFESAWSENPLKELLQKHELPKGTDPEMLKYFEEYNAGVDGVRATAEKYAFAALSPREAASVAQKAAFADLAHAKIFPAIQGVVDKLAKELEGARAEVAALKSARNPGIPVGDPSQPRAQAGESLDALWNRTVLKQGT